MNDFRWPIRLFIVMTFLLFISVGSTQVGTPQSTAPNEVFTSSVDTKLLLDAAGPEQRSALKNIYLIGCKLVGDQIAFGTVADLLAGLTN